ncbi:DUF4199 domain-containing protein [Mucilaginibacter lutimaris]|uniref:DUF4199 domain-containing protein n=1 Tax=Mucilaginibacter lutimaris TaxID=931629 RepID=A0ABW2ZF31_9SPHI
MKKTVIKFGLMSGLFVSVWMAISMGLCHNSGSYEGNMIVGFSSMIIAFSLMFPAVKSYRDKYNGGVISFGKAFTIAFLIALISSSMYVATWLVDYYFFMPDFMEKFSAQLITKAQHSGKSAAEIAEKIKDVNSMKKVYDSIFGVIFYTYREILPVGIIVALITALILKRRTNSDQDLVAQ